MFLRFFRNRKYTIILVLVILIVVGYGGLKWYEGKMFWVRIGAADPKFPFRQYTILEVVRLGKTPDLNTEQRAEFEQELKNLSTRTAPLETFDIYIQALKDGDIEKAADCLEKELESEMPPYEDEKGILHMGLVWRVPESDKVYLYKLKEEGELGDRIQKLEGLRAKIASDMAKIKKGSVGELEAKYPYRCWVPENEPCYLWFGKDLWGDWKLGGPRLF